MDKITDIAQLLKNANKCHPARSMPFRDLLSGLIKEIDNGYINEAIHPKFSNLHSYKYSTKCVAEKHWNIFTLMARGLVLDTKAFIIVATPFIKFFNYNEVVNIEEIITLEFEALEKIDGSMCNIFSYNNKWITTTMGSFISEQSKWAEKFLSKTKIKEYGMPGYTYITEVVYPENRIVVPYNCKGLFLLSIFDNKGYELSLSVVQEEAFKLHMLQPIIFDYYSLDDYIQKTKTMDYTQEGFVIKFTNGCRIKIKGEEYLRIHRLISTVTPLFIWDMLKNKDDTDRIINDLPENLKEDFNIIKKLLLEQLSNLLLEIDHFYQLTLRLTDQELGLLLQVKNDFFSSAVFDNSKNFIFPKRKGKFIDCEDKGSRIREKVFDVIRPRANILTGYTPSSMVNRIINDV